MAEYQLHCFAQSGNAYRAALMLNLIGADWQPVFVDFFGKGVQRSPGWRDSVNEMGEAPVLVHGAKKLSQSGVCSLKAPRMRGLSGSPEWRSSMASASSRPSRPK